MSEPGSKLPSCSPLAAAAAVAGAHADDAAAVDEQLLGRGLRQDRHTERLRLLGEEAPEPRERRDVVAVVDHRRRSRNPNRAALRQEEHRLAVHLARRTAARRCRLRSPKSRCSAARVDDRAGEQVRAGRLALLEHRDRYLAEPLGRLRVLLHQLPEPDRGREPGRTGADDQEADLDALVGRVGRRLDRLRRRPRRRIVRGPNAHDLRARTSSVSFGTISCRSPTTPRSENSKIGAFGSLLIATITFEPCMPTLCWMAPEMPSAT